MKINIAPPIQARVPRTLAAAPTSAMHEVASLPSVTLDLSRQLKFGDSQIDEAGVVLVELSVLVYERLDKICGTVNKLNFDAFRVMDAGPDRMDDCKWVEARSAKSMFSPGDLAVLGRLPVNGILGAPLSPLARGLLTDALLGVSRQPLSSPSSNPLFKPPVAPADREFDRRSKPPRALALLRGSDALIVFRGTQSLYDIGLDLCFWPARAWPLRHQGFEWTWHEVKEQVEAWLVEVEQQLGHKPNVYLGGHSLGGAVATLAAADLAPTHPIARVVTLGCPRAGGWYFRKRYRASKAAPAVDGTPRLLPDVTTRWVHGTDLFASLLPPPVFAAHVVPSYYLRPSDRLNLEDYFPTNLTDVTPLANLMARVGPKPGPLSTIQAPATSWTSDTRQIVARVAMWLAIALPWDWWTRIFLPLIPAAAEQLVRSLGQHSSARYLGFMPPTALFRAMHPPRMAPPR